MDLTISACGHKLIRLNESPLRDDDADEDGDDDFSADVEFFPDAFGSMFDRVVK